MFKSITYGINKELAVRKYPNKCGEIDMSVILFDNEIKLTHQDACGLRQAMEDIFRDVTEGD